MKITPEKILSLKSNEVFIFGSNEAGIHGGGAAFFANKTLGARWGMGFGRTSERTFAIPTKDWDIMTLPLPVIKCYISRFLAYARSEPTTEFLVTKIGCGLACLTPEQIAPFFFMFGPVPKNVALPAEFWSLAPKD